MMTTDQALLREYGQGGHAAFRELVERHAGLVYGAAWRVTGDRTMAEDVVQDVFCLLARKSASLAGHPSVAGWLHRTAANAARSQRRARINHEQKLARFASECRTAESPEPDGAARAGIDAAVDRLPADERAAVVLRFFEELDYTQIGGRLAISELAARKRVSRGLQRLQRIIGGTPTLSAGLAMAAPVDLVKSLLAAVPAPVPSAGIFSTLTLMTQKQTIAVASATILTGGLTWLSGSLWSENQRLGREVATLRTAALTSPVSQSGGNDQASLGRKATPLPASGSAAEVAGLRAELSAEREKRSAAERDAKAVRDQISQLEGEVVVSYGKVTEIGSTLGSVFTEAMALSDLEKKGAIDTPENMIRFGKFLEKASSISGLSKEIIGFEDAPEEGSRFIASTYGAAFGLDASKQEEIARFFSRTLADAKEKKLTLSNLPERGTEGFEPWLGQRWAYFNENRDQLRQLIPADQQESFDQWVEKGGYGFRNMTLKGMPMMFSLGGDPR